MSDPWFVIKLEAGKSQLALKTLRRLSIKFAYPERRTRVPRKPDIVEPIIPGYALVSFDPVQRIKMAFPSGTHYMHWSQFSEFPGVVKIFHDYAKPLAIAERYVENILIDASDPVKGYDIGRQVRILEGPFTSFMALVQAIDTDKGLVRVCADIFGRSNMLDYNPESLELV